MRTFAEEPAPEPIGRETCFRVDAVKGRGSDEGSLACPPLGYPERAHPHRAVPDMSFACGWPKGAGRSSAAAPSRPRWLSVISRPPRRRWRTRNRSS